MARTRLALVSLAFMLFTFFTAEVFVAGALTDIRDDLRQSSGAVGSLVSVYAGVAAVAILPMSLLTRKVPVRVLLPTAMGVLALSSAIMAGAPSLAWMMAARALAACFHGAVWASAPAVSAWLLPGRPGRATGYVFLGSSLGNLLGAPAVAAVSGLLNWRTAALGLAVLAGVCAIMLAAALPPGSPEDGTSDDTDRPRAYRSRGRIVSWCVLIVLIAAAHLASYTYITELAARARVPGPFISMLLLSMGAFSLAATACSGRVYDAHPTATVSGGMSCFALALAAVSLPVPWFVPATLHWAAAYAALTVTMQAAVLRDAPGWARLASTWYVLAFQIGIATGSAVGGATPTQHLSLVSALLASLAILASGAVAIVRTHQWCRSR